MMMVSVSETDSFLHRSIIGQPRNWFTLPTKDECLSKRTHRSAARSEHTGQGIGIASSPRGNTGFQEPLENDHITPHAAELRVLCVCVKMTRVCDRDHAPENRALLRHKALNVLRHEKTARLDRIGQLPQGREEHR